MLHHPLDRHSAALAVSAAVQAEPVAGMHEMQR
jgi:hypothetical protein